MRKYYGKAEPKYFVVGIIIIALMTVAVVGTVSLYSEKHTKSNPIGQYYNRTMTEKIDADAAVGILPNQTT